MSSIHYRIADPDDFAVTYDIATEAMTDFRLGQHGIEFQRPQSIQPRDLAMRQHCFQFYREAFWVAEKNSHLVGFAYALRQPGCWYLVGFHVLPKHQGLGIGGQLIDRTLSIARPSDIRCCVTDAIQTVAKHLYKRIGILPWVPLLEWEGSIPENSPVTAGDQKVCLANGPSQLGHIDRTVLGLCRSREHKFWLQQPGVACGLLVSDNVPLGYVYVSDSGDVGPLAVTVEPLAKTLLLWALGRLKGQGAERIHLKIPGQVPVVQEIATNLGMKTREPASVVLTSQPLWTAGHYLPSSGDSFL